MEYARTISNLDPYSGVAKLKRLRHKLALLALERPDQLVVVNMVAQFTESKYEKSRVKSINRAVNQADDVISTFLSYPSTKCETLHLATFPDASFATSEESSSQMGFLILLVCRAGRGCVLSFSSRK